MIFTPSPLFITNNYFYIGADFHTPIKNLLSMNTEQENQVVTLTTYATAAEAEVAASMLRSMGVEVSIVNEISSIMLPYINDNRVRLLVNSADKERALELLAAESVK